MNPHVLACKSVTLDQLALLLEDALSAATGWTVVPPQIQVLHRADGRANWLVDTQPMDDAMRAVVARMQQRYRVRTAPAGWRDRLAEALTGRRRGMPECQA